MTLFSFVILTDIHVAQSRRAVEIIVHKKVKKEDINNLTTLICNEAPNLLGKSAPSTKMRSVETMFICL